MDLTRRRFLQTSLTALAGASAGLWPLASRASEVVDFSLTARESLVNLGQGPEFKAYSFNGQSPGPVLRVREGQSLRVSLKNSLPHPTTIHWHGLPVPNPMDGVPGLTQAAVPPGGRFTYQFTARPAGTYFYHSHFGYQLDQGLYGALIVDPARPQGGWDREEVLLLSDWVMADGAGPASPRRRPSGGMMGGRMGRGGMGRARAGQPPGEPYYSGYAVNGRVYPAGEPIQVKRGDRVRLRLINASSATSYDLALAGHRLTVIALDGQPVSPRAFDVVRLSMGERADVEFVANNPGSWLLAAHDTGRGESGLAVPVVYAHGANRAPRAPAWRRDMRLATYWDLAAAEPVAHPPGEPGRWYRQVLSGGMHSGWWSINGRVHPDSERLRVEPGDKVRLSYFNRSMMPHPMHLHGHFFRIVNPRLEPERWLVKDTALVEPMRRLDVEFVADNPGQWFHHCHNLYHMEAGMANLVAYGPAAPPSGEKA
ncbi:MAG: multicopper oxidase family protein [Desulfarculaceae bacterium]|nr:multicopper oxidase family protein [Desulfarculaceae bacterium]MCF8073731.1 multicopper oxidase family protein [Desulfarculaceae bacterium]MCF8101972.1 multicopper oxidase family protein [Desulfarculaceae bacterium]MCF8115942.1 multicopper oxidase family protein [Desulfarculaceae bacterium]